MTEMEGQLPLFTLDGADEYIQRRYHDEGDGDDVCKECGQDCTSSRECAEFSGLSGLYVNDDDW